MIKQYFNRLLNVPADTRKLGCNNDTGLLKIFACLLMLSDHMGKMIFPHIYTIRVDSSLVWLFPTINIMRGFGRLAMPMFAYCIAVGCARTRNIWKYALRLLLMGILVHPLYQEAMGHVTLGAFDWLHDFWRLDLIYSHYYSSNLNIFFTLFIPVVIIALYRSKTYLPAVLMCMAAWLLNGRIDYGWHGVALVLLFYAFIDRPLVSLVSYVLFMLSWTMPYLGTGRLTSTAEFYAIYAALFIYLPLKRRVKLHKWAFYAFYPAHLLLILLLQIC